MKYFIVAVFVTFCAFPYLNLTQKDTDYNFEATLASLLQEANIYAKQNNIITIKGTVQHNELESPEIGSYLEILGTDDTRYFVVYKPHSFGKPEQCFNKISAEMFYINMEVEVTAVVNEDFAPYLKTGYIIATTCNAGSSIRQVQY